MNSENTYSLAATALTEYWNEKADHLILAGYWCVQKENSERRKIQQTTLFPYPWPDNKRADVDYYYCMNLYEKILPEFTSLLNRLHGEKYSVDYWRIVVGPWLCNFIQTAHEKFTLIQEIKKVYPHISTTMPSVVERPIPQGYYEYAYMAKYDRRYNQFLFGDAARFLGIPIFEETARGKNPDVICLRSPQKWRKFFVSTLNPVLKFLSFRAEILHVASVFRPVEMLKLWVQSGFRIFPFLQNKHYQKDELGTVDRERRMSFRSLPTADDFSRFLVHILPDHIPYSHVEGYAGYRAKALNDWPRNTKLIATSYLYSTIESGKIWLAQQAEKGTKILNIQHGGSYGLFKRCFATEHETQVSDYSASWGWQRLTKPHVFAMPSPVLNRVKGISGVDPLSSERILFLPWEFYEFTDNYQRGPFGGMIQKYVEQFHHFLYSLSPEMREKVVVRCHSSRYALNSLQELSPGLKKDDNSVKLTQSMFQARLTVVNYIGSTFLELLAANLPVLFFWDSSFNTYEDDVIEDFLKLEKAGILVTHPEKAAASVMKIYADPLVWWQSDVVQSAKNLFVKKYGVKRKDWMKYWAVRIQELADQEDRVQREIKNVA